MIRWIESEVLAGIAGDLLLLRTFGMPSPPSSALASGVHPHHVLCGWRLEMASLVRTPRTTSSSHRSWVASVHRYRSRPPIPSAPCRPRLEMTHFCLVTSSLGLVWPTHRNEEHASSAHGSSQPPPWLAFAWLLHSVCAIPSPLLAMPVWI